MVSRGVSGQVEVERWFCAGARSNLTAKTAGEGSQSSFNGRTKRAVYRR